MSGMMEGYVYLAAGSKSWNRRVFDAYIRSLPGEWHYIGKSDELTLEYVRELSPRYIFFLHWSWKVPEEIIDRFECVCFHMTDLPYGRGGSPLQNLIERGHQHTKLTALRMTHEFDAGPIYAKEQLCLHGSAEEIYIRASYRSAEMIRWVIEEEPEPVPQTGETTVFRRRKPDESRIPDLDSLERLHDFIRMLDAEGYPLAFIDHRGFQYEFHRAVLYDGRVEASVTIKPLEEEP